jgi:hypothetical protein
MIGPYCQVVKAWLKPAVLSEPICNLSGSYHHCLNSVKKRVSWNARPGVGEKPGAHYFLLGRSA